MNARSRSTRYGLVSLSFLAATLACVGCGSQVRVKETFDFTSDWKNYETIDVRGRNGKLDLAVDSSGGTSVRISGEKWAAGATEESARSILRALDVKAFADPANPANLIVELQFPEGGMHPNAGADIVVRAPQAAAAKLKSSNGTITVVGMKRVNGETSNGGVLLTEIEGAAKIETSNGSVTIRGVGGALDADTSNGNIDASGVRGAVSLESSNGSITLDATPPDNATVSLKSSNGNIRATLPSTMKATLDLDTSNGAIAVEMGSAVMTEKQAGKRAFNAKMNGGGGTITAETSNGSITLKSR